MSNNLECTGLGGGKFLRVLFALSAGCGLSVSSARAGMMASWTFDTGGAQNGTALSGSAVGYGANTFDTTALSAASISAVTIGPNAAGQGTAAGNFNNGSQPNLTSMQFTAAKATLSSPINNVNGCNFVLSLTVGSSAISSGTLTITYDVFTAQNEGTIAGNSWALAGAGTGNATVAEAAQTYQSVLWVNQITVQFTGVSFAANSTFTLTDMLQNFQNSTQFGAEAVGFDNISVAFDASPVPEPTNYALAVFGLVFIGVGACRFYRNRRLAEAS